MYLTSLEVNSRSRSAQRDLANRYDLHRTVMSLFPTNQSNNARGAGQVLYRCDLGSDGTVRILVQSNEPPNVDALAPGYLGVPAVPKQLDPFLDTLKEGDVLRFKLEANATKRDIRTRKRVEVRGDEAQQAWLERQASRHGFELVRVGSGVADARTQAAPKTLGWKKGEGDESGRSLTFGCTTFEGRLRVVDPVRLREAVRSGIGPAKAFGFGLLSLGRSTTEQLQ